MSQEGDSSASSRKRQVAIKVQVKHVVNAPFVQEEGWTANYLELENVHASRINVIGHLVAKDDRGAMLDDGTGSVPLRTFEPLPQMELVNVGDCVLVIGRPREYNGERYVIPEIMKKIDKEWLSVRQHELKDLEVKVHDRKTAPKEMVTPAAEAVIEEEEIADTPERKLFDLIKHEDNGEGAEIQAVCEKVANGEAVLKKLLEQGDIFEVKPGFVKVLE